MVIEEKKALGLAYKRDGCLKKRRVTNIEVLTGWKMSKSIKHNILLFLILLTSTQHPDSNYQKIRLSGNKKQQPE